MSHDIHHEHLVKELTEQLEPVFTNSTQAIYLYLDDVHKSCNQKFADLLGYNSIDEWVANDSPVSDVLEGDQDKIINAYMDASRDLIASTQTVTLVTKEDKHKKVEVIMTPLSYKNEVFVLHFISDK